MIRRPPRSTPKPSSAASDVYKRQGREIGKRGSGRVDPLPRSRSNAGFCAGLRLTPPRAAGAWFSFGRKARQTALARSQNATDSRQSVVRFSATLQRQSGGRGRQTTESRQLLFGPVKSRPQNPALESLAIVPPACALPCLCLAQAVCPSRYLFIFVRRTNTR